MNRIHNTSSPSHTHTHMHVSSLVGPPPMPMGAQLLPGSYSLCLLPGTLLHTLGQPCGVLEQKSWMSSDGPADVFIYFLWLWHCSPKREGLSSPQACMCLYLSQQSNFDKCFPLLEHRCPLTAAGGCSHVHGSIPTNRFPTLSNVGSMIGLSPLQWRASKLGQCVWAQVSLR